MLLSRRRAAIPELSASLTTHALVHSAFRVHAVENHGVIAEDRLSLRAFDRRGHVERPVLTIVLSGRARLETDARVQWLEAGDVALIPQKANVRMRQEGDTYRSLAFEWKLGSLGGCPLQGDVTRLPPVDLARLILFADSISSSSLRPAQAAPMLSTAVELLRALGAPFDLLPAGDLVETVPPAVTALSDALDRTLSNLRGQPMLVDFDRDLSRSSRHVQRIVSAFNLRYGWNAEGWRDTLRRRRVLLGSAFMCAEGATTEGVASALGYGNATAFCRALAQAGLPSPGTLAREVLALA